LSNLVATAGRLPMRFMAKIHVQPDGCWTWQAYTRKDGYGVYGVGSTTVYAHRFAYESIVGPIPPGMTLDHLCRVRCCVNPEHLEVVGRGENVRRGDAGIARGAQLRARTHCPKGHPYDGDNLGIRPDGSRRCRACGRDRWHARKQREA
jgi:hypothetical protein